MVVEAELIAAASDALVATRVSMTSRFDSIIGRCLNGILAQAGIAADKHDDALIALDKMDKAGPEGVARELNQRGIVDESAAKLMRFFEGLAGAERAVEMADFDDATHSLQR